MHLKRSLHTCTGTTNMSTSDSQYRARTRAMAGARARLGLGLCTHAHQSYSVCFCLWIWLSKIEFHIMITGCTHPYLPSCKVMEVVCLLSSPLLLCQWEWRWLAVSSVPGAPCQQVDPPHHHTLSCSHTSHQYHHTCNSSSDFDTRSDISTSTVTWHRSSVISTWIVIT